jgi:hypothetical protein
MAAEAARMAARAVEITSKNLDKPAAIKRAGEAIKAATAALQLAREDNL